MTHSHPPFPDDRGDHAPDASFDPEFLLELAAWADGTLPADRIRALEARLADDPPARALAASVRLRPVTPTDAAAPLPAAVVARATALVPGATEAGHRGRLADPGPASDEPADRWRWRWQLVPVLQAAGGLAACFAAAAIGWQLGGTAGQPAPGPGRQIARSLAVENQPAEDDGTLLAAASFGVFEDADEDALGFLLLGESGMEGVTQ